MYESIVVAIKREVTKLKETAVESSSANINAATDGAAAPVASCSIDEDEMVERIHDRVSSSSLT